MFSISFFLLVGVLVSSAVIAWQDVRERLVSLWALVIFSLFCVLSVVMNRDWQTLLMNGAGTLCYFALIWLGLKAYVYLKFNKKRNILNEYLGSADVIVILSIGLTFNFIGCVFFFCFAFIVSLLLFLGSGFLRNNQSNDSVPLAGLLVLAFSIAIFVLPLLTIYRWVDCSFIN